MPGVLETEMRELTLVVSEEALLWLGRISGQQALDFYLIYISRNWSYVLLTICKKLNTISYV